MNSPISKSVGLRIADRYSITGVIGSGAMGLVYRAIPFDDPSHEVAIKIIQTGKKLSTFDLINFQKEAAVMSQLYHNNIISFHELGLLDDKRDSEAGAFLSGYYIVMEIANGLDLKEQLKRAGRRPIDEFFDIAIQVTDALDYTHGKNIIHRDIKPQNMIVNYDASGGGRVEVKILDFGVARLAETMHSSGGQIQSANGLDDIAGTPLYMAPEQTPFVSAPIDHRIDLYSLGCVFYEVLAGKPPFTHKTREKLQRAHAYEEPEPLRNLRPDTPPILEKIVFTLLEKNPNLRYQSAFGLLSDLHQARIVCKAKAGLMFPLGTKDRFKSVAATVSMVGREEELASLQSTFNQLQTDQARSRISIISGPAGSGKSRILNSFRAHLGSKQARFISGSFSQHEANLPYNALANAFNDYLVRILQHQPELVEQLRDRFKNVLGPAISQVATVVPSILAFVKSDDEDEADIYPPENEISPSFVKAFSDFTRCLALDDQPLVFIFDNLHWADEKSLQLVNEFFSYNNSQRFYLVVACRAEERDAKLDRFIEKFAKLKRRYQFLELPPISQVNTREICQDMLGSDAVVGDDLMQALFEKTKGNPLHLVDHIKVLVARDLLSPSIDGKRWEYEINRIRSFTVPFDTIDLVLSKIHELSPPDRNYLEIAATIGLSFSHSTLLAVAEGDRAGVEQALSSAHAFGLIALAIETMESDSIGYRFRHRKAREALYNTILPERRSELHRRIAETMVDFSEKTDSQTIFSIVHHYNKAIVGPGAKNDVGLAGKSLLFNVKAAQRAINGDSLLTAEKYLENALKISAVYQKKIIDDEKLAWIMEQLAMISERQNKHGVALNLYQKILASHVTPQVWARIAYKAVRLQQIGGVLTKSLNLVRTALTRFGYQIPKDRPFRNAFLYVRLAMEAYALRRGSGPILTWLGRLRDQIMRGKILRDEYYSPDDFYYLGSQMGLFDNVSTALAYHTQSWKTLNAKSSPFLIFAVCLFRGGVYAHFGYKRTAYSIFDFLMQVSRGVQDRHFYGLVCLYKSLTIDYMNARFEEVETNSVRALKYISASRGRVHFGFAMMLRSYMLMERGNIVEALKYLKRTPDILPMRNPLTARAFTLILFLFLLKGARDSIVKYGDFLLKRRDKSAGRRDDLFMYTNQCMISLAKGDFEDVRRYFIAAADAFTMQGRVMFLYPFEEEFVGLFLCAFPMIFEQEVGKRIMREDEIKMFNTRLQRKIFSMRERNSPTFLLLRARFLDISGQKMPNRSGNVKRLYDDALRRANENNNRLALAFGYLWFGEHFLRNGNQNKIHYIKRSFDAAHQFGIKCVVDYIQTKYNKMDFGRAKSEGVGSLAGAGQFQDAVSPLIVGSLRSLTISLTSSRTVEEGISECLAQLERDYTFTNASVLVTRSERLEILYQKIEKQGIEALAEYLEPYFNVRSTLFLPAADAPWAGNVVRVSKNEANGADSSGQNSSFAIDTATQVSTSPTLVELDLESTLVMREDSKVGADYSGTKLSALTIGSHISSKTGSQVSSRAGSANLAMNAILPIKYLDGNVGVLFLEGVQEKQKGRDIQRRVELDVFGSQLGVLLVQKGAVHAQQEIDQAKVSSEDERARLDLTFSPGAIQLEPLPWMKIWHFGKPRTSRESVWYLGVNLGASRYLLVYSQLLGAPEHRERLNAMLWYQLIVQRSLSSLSSGETTTADEIRDLFASLVRAVEEFSCLESISIAFSLFDRKKQSMSGGHFGQARPVVLGSENDISPYNEVVIHFQNGKELRYWGVAADMSEQRPYLLSYDTSQLSLSGEHGSLQSFREEARQSRDRLGMHDALERAIRGSGLPRYYVASVIIPPSAKAVVKRDRIDLVG